MNKTNEQEKQARAEILRVVAETKAAIDAGTLSGDMKALTLEQIRICREDYRMALYTMQLGRELTPAEDDAARRSWGRVLPGRELDVSKGI